MSEELGYQRPMAAEIDDPEDLQDSVIARVTKGAPDFRMGKRDYVIWTGMLPSRWRSLLYPVTSKEAAKQLLTDALKNGLKLDEELKLARELGGSTAAADKEARRQLIIDGLVDGALWVIKKRAKPEKGKADPAIYAAINGKLGTQVEFAFLGEWEGGQYLHGYFPFSNRSEAGTILGRSGMTIATGFDVGQKSAAELKGLGLEQALLDKLSPFAGLTFKGKTRAQVIEEVQRLNSPIPKISVEQANLLDRLIHEEHLQAAVSAYNAARQPGVPAFNQLPANWQTVLFSRFFHQGKGAHRTAVIKPFWNALTKGDWEAAAKGLESYGVSEDWYKNRVTKEAKHLRKEMPPKVVVPEKPKAPGGGPKGQGPRGQVRMPDPA